ncbi:MAG: protein kinase [Myxococcales bacterium]
MQEPSTGQVLGGRFELREKLGEGGMGAVYEAQDLDGGARLALKTFRRFSGDELYKLKREFRAVADVQHPNLVRLGELHRDGDRWFFTMELVRGKPLLAYVSHRADGSSEKRSEAFERDHPTLDLEVVAQQEAPSGRRLREKPLRACLLQLAQALTALHRAGRVHCDVKPSNVMVDQQGRVVLLDFGISAELGHRQRSDERIAGTLAYMAPEQATLAVASPAADWYAFGALLFEALTGRVPFAGAADEVLRAKQFGPPPEVASEGIPTDLLALSLALLQSAPDERPSPGHIVQVLGGGSVDDASSARLPLVGRDGDLGLLREALEPSFESARWVTISGVPGIGKTALMQHAVEEHVARHPQVLVLRGRCYEQESVPYKAWDNLMDALSDHLLGLHDSERAKLLPDDRHELYDLQALGQVFPVLRRVPLIDAHCRDHVRSGWPTEVERRARGGLIELLREACSSRSILLAVDDLHWADAESLSLFVAVLSAGLGRIALLCTTRSANLALGAEAGVSHRHLALGPLSESSAEALARLVLAEAGRPERARALSLEGEGHPLHVLELCRYEHLRQPSERVRLLDSLRARIHALDPAAKALVELVAVARAPLPLAALARAANLPVATCQQATQVLCVQHLLQASVSHGLRCIEPYHDRVREACLESLQAGATPATWIESLLLRLGRALHETLSGQARAVELPRIARYLRAGYKQGEPADRALAVDVSTEAALKLRRAGAFAQAIEHAESALALLGSTPFASDYERARELHRELMTSWALSHALERSNEHYELLLASVQTPLDRASVHSTRVWLEMYEGAHAEAMATALRGLAELDIELPSRPQPHHLVAAMGDLARSRLWCGGDIAARELCRDPRILQAQELLLSLAPPAFTTGQSAVGALAMLRIVELSLRHGVTSASAYGVAGLGMALGGGLGFRHVARRCGDAALALSERVGDTLIGSYVDMLCGAFIVPWVAPLPEARALLERAMRRALEAGDRIHVAFVASNISLNILLQGRSFADVAQLEHLSDLIADVGLTWLSENLRIPVRSFGHLQERDGTRKSEDFVHSSNVAFDHQARRSPAAVHYYHGVNQGIALYFDHAFDLAAATFARADQHRSASFALPLEAEHLFYAALTSAQRSRVGPLERARDHLLRARALKLLTHWEASSPTTFAPRRWLLSAECQRLRGDHGRAIAQLERAAELACRHGNGVLFALALERRADCLEAISPERARAARPEVLAAWRAVEGHRIAWRLTQRWG